MINFLSGQKTALKFSPYLSVVLLLFSMLMFIAPFLLGAYGLSLLIQIIIFALLALSLNVLIGYTGLFSFNHATFFGISGYTAGILYLHGAGNFWLLSGAAIAISTLLAAFIGLLVLRSSGPYFFMITLAFGQMVFALVWKWRELTGGDDGLPGIARPGQGLPFSLWDNKSFYYFVLVIFILCTFVLWSLLSSRLGRTLKGVRESESRMQALGYNTWLIKYSAYVISAAFAAVAGILNAFFNNFVSPQDLNWTMSGMIMLMVIMGGAGTFTGPIAGAAAIVLLQSFISSYTEHWTLVVGVIYIVCVMYLRNGIAGYANILLQRGRRYYESFRNKGPA